MQLVWYDPSVQKPREMKTDLKRRFFILAVAAKLKVLARTLFEVGK